MKTILRHMVIGALSGYAGSKVMNLVTTALYDWTPEAAKEREKRVSPGLSYNVAARDLAGRVGIQLADQEASKVGALFHQGLALGAGEMYVALRQTTSLAPIWSALVVSMTLFVGVDEGMTPLMGWSAPVTAYPLATHLRGLIGHLALGATVAMTAESLSRLFASDR
jgi:uncharacterized membrane protein YagU involved in acid resistance